MHWPTDLINDIRSPLSSLLTYWPTKNAGLFLFRSLSLPHKIPFDKKLVYGSCGQLRFMNPIRFCKNLLGLRYRRKIERKKKSVTNVEYGKKEWKERKTDNEDKSINLSTSLSSNDDCNRGLVWYVCVCHRTINIHETWYSERGNRMKKVPPRATTCARTTAYTRIYESIKNFNAHEELRIRKRTEDDDKEREKKREKNSLETKQISCTSLSQILDRDYCSYCVR